MTASQPWSQASRPAGGAILALSGGIGGAKLALGLSHALPPERLTVVVNTGDDFEHLGLAVSPDLDTVLYTLAGLANPETGWGRRDETWSFMAALESLGGPTWFKLGDGDLAMHVERTRRLAAGERITVIADDIRARLGIGARVLPMTDARVRTLVETDEGVLAFQEYFVARQSAPRVSAIRFEGAEEAAPAPEVAAALAAPELAGIVVCPSNPWLSVDPILALAGMRAALRAAGVPIVAVSPLVGGAAVKGPTGKIMDELGLARDQQAIAAHYAGLVDGFVLDHRDAAAEATIDSPVLVTNTLMRSLDDRIRLAADVVAFCHDLGRRQSRKKAQS
ncbi:MAG: 2-phospho-L-lactate transferase [Hyphomicrobiaceae bacterium]